MQVQRDLGDEYRFEVLGGEIAVRMRDWLRQRCKEREVTIVQGPVSPDRVQMLVRVMPQLARAKPVQYMKGRSSRMLQDEFPQLQTRYCGQQFGRVGISLRA
jgi:putative transposase